MTFYPLASSEDVYEVNKKLDTSVYFVETFAANGAITAGQLVDFLNGSTPEALDVLSAATGISGEHQVHASFRKAIALDTNKALVVYPDSSNSNYGTAVVVTVSGTTITAGTPTVFHAGTTANYGIADICKLDSSRALVIYSRSDDSNYVNGQVLNVSGTTITAGTKTRLTIDAYATTPDCASIALINTNKVAFVFNNMNNSYYAAASILTISGDNISVGTKVDGLLGSNGNFGYTSIEKVKTDYFIVAAGVAGYAQMTVCSVSGTTITKGSPVMFSPNSSPAQFGRKLIYLQDNKLLAIFMCNSNLDSAIITVSGTVPTMGSTTRLSSGTAGMQGIVDAVLYDTDKAVCVGNASNTANTPPTHVVTVSVSGSSVILDDSAVILSTEANMVFATLGSGKALTFKRDATDGFCKASIFTSSKLAGEPVGISLDTVANGGDARILFSGTADGLSGLVPGRRYYQDVYGHLSIDSTFNNTLLGGSVNTTKFGFFPFWNREEA